MSLRGTGTVSYVIHFLLLENLFRFSRWKEGREHWDRIRCYVLGVALVVVVVEVGFGWRSRLGGVREAIVFIDVTHVLFGWDEPSCKL